MHEARLCNLRFVHRLVYESTLLTTPPSLEDGISSYTHVNIKIYEVLTILYGAASH
jgi:hypothetical protein